MVQFNSDVEVDEPRRLALNAIDPDADEELRLLRDALRGALGAPAVDEPPAPDPDWRAGWPALADLGITALCVPESAGGFGLRVDAAVATSSALGAVLHGAPYSGTAAAAHALATGDADRSAGLLAGLLDGSRSGAVAHLDRDGAIARLVDGGAAVDVLLLATGESDGDELLLLDDPSTWRVRATHPFDVTRTVADVEVDLAAARPITAPVTLDLHGLLLAADALGGVERMLDRTVAYAGHRQAFGRAIGGFQAVQHRLADHAVRAKGMARLVDEAARLLGAGAPDAPRAVRMAEASVGGAAVHLLHDLLQLTGAIGFTWEHGLHLYERRAQQDARLRSNPRAAVRALATIEGWTDGR